MQAAAPVLELLMAEVAATPEFAVAAPLSLRLLPGQCVVIEGDDAAQLSIFADLCSGLIPLRSGQVKCLGYDWIDLPHDIAAALRGRIGRVFVDGDWIPFLDAETNILLPHLHHTRRSRLALQAEATTLAREFGLPGLPQDRLADLSATDIAKAMLVRAFLGQPLLLLLEEPARAPDAALLNRVLSVGDRGGGVIWLIGTRRSRQLRTFAASRWLRLTGNGLLDEVVA